MLSYRQKRLYYLVANPLMAMNATRYKLLNAPAKGNGDFIKVHLGPGQSNYVAGWINVDANMFTARCDLWANIEGRLPFNDSSVDALYSHHVVEHLLDIDRHFVEAYRILKPGGAYRVGAPNGESAVRKFLEKDELWFGDFPRSYRSLGGRLNNFLLCAHEHHHIITECYLKELGELAGFKKIVIGVSKRETTFPYFREVFEKEWEDDPTCSRTLIVEFFKYK